MPFVGGPNTRITNTKWRTGAILDKSKNHHISTMFQVISTKFGTVMVVCGTVSDFHYICTMSEDM